MIKGSLQKKIKLEQLRKETLKYGASHGLEPEPID